ncbi:MAG: MBL fold metallo-hydrolase [Rikenellaceae bacterium]|jgi:glyoxylase-like metal-dependent hydrolase (beta-lactamase superfamily II)|nr:MBL fold metallo-hydrolase [Rikenellaceae bacterium]
MINVAVLPFNSFQENTYVLSDETGACLIVDPGNNNDREDEKIAGYIEGNGLKPTLIVNTHGHVDHLLGVRFLQERYGIPLAMHGGDAFLLPQVPLQGRMYGFTISEVPVVDRDLADEKSLRFGNSELEILHVPGHSPGHIALYSRESEFVIVGDVLFRGSIGRTDLPGGDYHQLMTSIIGQILPLGGHITVYPGHGRPTTISQEVDRNPFIREVIDGEVNF